MFIGFIANSEVKNDWAAIFKLEPIRIINRLYQSINLILYSNKFGVCWAKILFLKKDNHKNI